MAIWALSFHCWNWYCHLSYRFLRCYRTIHVDLMREMRFDGRNWVGKVHNIININKRSRRCASRLFAAKVDWRVRLHSRFSFLCAVSDDKLKMKRRFFKFTRKHLHESSVQQFCTITCDPLEQPRRPHPLSVDSNSKLDKNLLFNFFWFCYVLLWVFELSKYSFMSTNVTVQKGRKRGRIIQIFNCRLSECELNWYLLQFYKFLMQLNSAWILIFIIFSLPPVESRWWSSKWTDWRDFGKLAR